MIGRTTRKLAVLAAVLAAALVPVPRAHAAAPDGAGRGAAPPGGLRLPASVKVRAGKYEDLGKVWRMSGYVDIDAGDASIKADEVLYHPDEKTVEASGNVVLTFPGAVLAGTRLVYHLDTQRGTIDDAVGYLEQDNATLRARRVERIGPQRLRVETATFTSCTQPTPYWSFKIHKGTFDLGKYAYLQHVRFKISALPVFYSPYLVWPIKTDRASGILFPEFTSSNKLGKSISLPVFWAFTDNADATFLLDMHDRVGPALGVEFNWLPTWRGRAEGFGYYIHDEIRNKQRYRIDWRQQQPLGNNFKLTMALQSISDFDYLTDYETDLLRAAAPQTLSNIDLTRHWSWYSLSLRARNHQQFFVGEFFVPYVGTTSLLTGEVTNTKLPEVEMRGRSQRLGRSPFYLAFVASVDGFERRIQKPSGDAQGVGSEAGLHTVASSRWARVDVNPTVQAPLLKTPWADLVIDGGWRGTWYSARRDPKDVNRIDKRALWRSLFNVGVGFTGPRFQRVFLTPKSRYSPKYKHVIEPFVRYDWRPAPSIDPTDVVVVDEIDSVPGQRSDFSYGIRQRLFALRPAETGRPTGIATARTVSFAALEKESRSESERTQRAGAAGTVEPQLDTSQSLGPTEVASLTISHQWSTVHSMSARYFTVVDPETGAPVLRSAPRDYSAIAIRARYNPTQNEVIDLTLGYDPANHVLTDTSLSVMSSLGERGYLRGSWYRRVSPTPYRPVSSDFIRTQWGLALFSRRLNVETAWDFNVETGRLDHQWYQVRYGGQCCSVQVGYDVRDFVANVRHSITLTVDLSGIGHVLDLHQSMVK